jgi:hypothetical protein
MRKRMDMSTVLHGSLRRYEHRVSDSTVPNCPEPARGVTVGGVKQPSGFTSGLGATAAAESESVPMSSDADRPAENYHNTASPSQC